jgi:hypothetical protein
MISDPSTNGAGPSDNLQALNSSRIPENIQETRKFFFGLLSEQRAQMEENFDHFRVYSDRPIDAGSFLWNPYMDLLGVIPADAQSLSVSVYRLIDDKQTGSPLLFIEKVPFPPTAIAWVPDKRGLTVGDANGNVFVFDAERQRTIELQKVHDCAIRSIDWVEVADENKSLFDDRIHHSRLPSLVATPASFQQFFGDVSATAQEGHIDDSERLVNESLASSDRQTFMSVLGEQGNIQMYHGGSIPVCEFSVPNLFQETRERSQYFSSAQLSPDLSSLAVLVEDISELHVYLVNTALLRFRRRELFKLCRIESDTDYLLRQLNACMSTVERAVSSTLEDFDSSLGSIIGDIDEELLRDMQSGQHGAFLQDFLSREFSAPGKLTKLARTTLCCLDYLVVMLISRARVIVNHLVLNFSDLSELGLDVKFLCFGIHNARELLQMSQKMRSHLDLVIDQVQDMSFVLKHVFVWLETGAPISSSETHLIMRRNPAVISSIKSLIGSLTVLSEGKDLELLHLSLLSNQRRAIASRMTPLKLVSFPRETISRAQIAWSDEKLDLCYIDQTLVLCRIVRGEVTTRLEFEAPERSEWKFARLYKSGEICTLLIHQDKSVSVCLLDFSSWLNSTRRLTPDDYGFPAFFIAQQLPPGSAAVGLGVSGPRGLCSVHLEGGRMVTLDLENADDDGTESAESESSPEPVGRVRRNLRKHDSLLDGENRSNVNTPPSSDHSESNTPVVQRLKFAL